ncbi:cytochrome P450 [Nocardia macrotermitis]|uniref:Cytochrome P450 107B1 n=1 Tax=Nocardia macrotermitis TaxID=2585198 RepID=A0A7K0DAD1_9NOCA|nr:cytochrome P450 [Nocardia macrotermitis]MQY22501.1 Cytochrome P450 107B1 [Nocardia macrotermitis]
MINPSMYTESDRIALYSPEFAAMPHHCYRDMRKRYGSLVPAELSPGVPATLVIGYRTAVQILHDPAHFPVDPRTWEKDVPDECPVKPMLAYRPNAIHSSGEEHRRYRDANVAALGGVDLHGLHAVVERVAVPLISRFCEIGSADLVADYARPLAFQVVNEMLGCSPDIGHRVSTGVLTIFNGEDAAAGNTMLIGALSELVAGKRADPGNDVTTRLVQHPAGFDDQEVIEQLVPLYGAGVEPVLNLIANTLLLILTNERFAGSLLGGSLSTRDALDEVLFLDPPIANFCMTYPRQPVLLDDVWLPAHQPVIISIAACNNDPAISGGDYTGNRSHLAWGAGPHACPARQSAYLIAQDGVDQLLDALPEIELAGDPNDLIWRPGPFHRALSNLPVTFEPSQPFLGWHPN